MELIKPAFAQTTPADLGPHYGFGGPNYTTFGQFFTSLIGSAFGIVGALLVIYIIWGGYKWLSSGGNKESVASAQQMITHAVIGVFLLVILFIIFRFVPEIFGVDLHIFG